MRPYLLVSRAACVVYMVGLCHWDAMGVFDGHVADQFGVEPMVVRCVTYRCSSGQDV